MVIWQRKDFWGCPVYKLPLPINIISYDFCLVLVELKKRILVSSIVSATDKLKNNYPYISLIQSHK